MDLGPANADKGEAPPAGSPWRDLRRPDVVHALLISMPHTSLTAEDPRGQQSHRAGPGLPSRGAACSRRASLRQRPLSKALITPSPMRKVIPQTSETTHESRLWEIRAPGGIHKPRSWPVPGRRASDISPRGPRRFYRGPGTGPRWRRRCPRGADGVAEAGKADSPPCGMMAEGRRATGNCTKDLFHVAPSPAL